MKKYFPYFYFFTCCIIFFIVYYPAREGCFVLDFMGFAYRYDHDTWMDILKCKADHSYHVFFHIIYYSAYNLFHTHANRWLLLFSTLNAAVLALAFVVFRKVLQQAQIHYATGIALAGSLLVLFNPYMDETVIWGPALHYPLAVALLFISWLLVIKYFETSSVKYLWLAHIVFFVSIYSLEIGVVFPFILALYFWLWTKPVKVNIQQALMVLLPQFIIIFSYFAMNKIMFGDWVGHYGATVHLNLPPAFLASQLACYLLKYIGFVHFLDFSKRNSVYSFVQQNTIGYLLLIVLYVVPILLFIIINRKNKTALKTGLLIYFFACFALFTTQNLYFTDLFRSENDRHGYFFALFIYLIIAFILIRSFKWFGYIIIFVYGIIGYCCLKIQVNDWRQAGNVVRTLVNEYQWGNNPGKVHILCIGDNINGAYLFKSLHDSAFFGECYEVLKRKECSPVEQYATMTMNSENDSVNAIIVNDSTIQVNLLTGNWFMNNGLGAVDYKTTNASFKLIPQKPSFQITFKNKKPGDVYIYESGLHWKQVNGF